MHAIFSEIRSVILLTVKFIILVHDKSLHNDVVLFRKELLSIDEIKTWKTWIYLKTCANHMKNKIKKNFKAIFFDAVGGYLFLYGWFLKF